MKKMSTLTFPDGSSYEVMDKVARAIIESEEWHPIKTVVGVAGVILPDKAIAFTSDNKLVSGFTENTFFEGAKYKVTWGGVEYETACYVEDSTYLLGNGVLAGMTTATDHPFCFASFGGSSCIVYKSTTDAETINVKIEGVQEVIFDKLPKEYLPDDINAGGGGGGADWNENDANASGYIKNRPFYSEESRIVEVLPETQWTYDESEGVFLYNEAIDIKEGNEYLITINGQKHTCIAQAIPVDGMNYMILGNPSLVGAGNDTGEAFTLLTLPNVSGMYAMFVLIDGSTEATISISYREVGTHKLDNKYLNLEWLPVDKEVIIAEKATATPSNTVSQSTVNYPDVSKADIENEVILIYIDGIQYKPNFTEDGDYLTAGNKSIINNSEANTEEIYYCVVSDGDTDIFSGLTIIMNDNTEHEVYVCKLKDNPIPEKFLHTVVNFTVNSDNTVTADKTPAEVLEIINNGGRVHAVLDWHGQVNQCTMNYQSVSATVDFYSTHINFTVGADGKLTGDSVVHLVVTNLGGGWNFGMFSTNAENWN